MNNPAAPTRVSIVVRGLAALAVLVLLLGGFPVVLYLVGGSPLPSSLPTWPEITTRLRQPDTDGTLFLGTVRLIGWSAWLLFALTSIVETIGGLRGRTTPRLPRPIRPMQRLARDLIAAITLVITTATPMAGASAIPASQHTAATIVTELPATPAVAATASASQHHALPANDGRTHLRDGRAWHTYVIKRGDTLWSIARREYGSGRHYPKIFAANSHLDQPHGLPPLTDPDEIYPGQHLKISAPNGAPHQPGKPHQPGGTQPSTHPTPPRQSSPPHPGGTHHPTAPTPRPTTSPTSRPSPTSNPPTTTPPHQRPTHHPDQHRHPTVIDLPSGALVGASLAASISTAILLTRLHRRRRHRPAPVPGQSPPDPPPSLLRRRLRRAHLDQLHGPADDAGDLAPDQEAPAEKPELPAYAPSDEFAIATREGREILINLPRLGGLGLQGPGADDAARAIITAVLATGNPNDTEVVIPRDDLRRLLGPAGDLTGLTLPATLTVKPTLGDALSHVEAELIHRTRQLDYYDSDDFAAVRREHPDEPLPTLVLVATPALSAMQQLAAMLTFGRDQGVAAVLLGLSPSGTTCALDADGRITEITGHEAENLRDGQLFHLPPADAADLLAVLTTARGGQERQRDIDVEQVQPTPNHQTRAETMEQVPAAPATTQPVHLTVLGAVRVYAGDDEIATGLRSNARAFLAYLAAHPDGVTLENTLAAMWPDHDPKRAAVQFRAAVGNIRKVLRQSTGASQARFILYTAERYRLDPHMVDVDLWRFQTALDEANHAGSDNAAIAALTRAADVYRADFTAGHGYEWAEPLRESLHRHAVDALARLAELQHSHPEQALLTLEQALDLDQRNEDLYRRTITVLARLGRADAMRRTYRLLQTRLADIDADPEPATERLLSDLLHRLHARERRSVSDR